MSHSPESSSGTGLAGTEQGQIRDRAGTEQLLLLQLPQTQHPSQLDASPLSSPPSSPSCLGWVGVSPPPIPPEGTELWGTGGEVGAALPACPGLLCVPPEAQSTSVTHPRTAAALGSIQPSIFQLLNSHLTPGAASCTPPCPPEALHWEDLLWSSTNPQESSPTLGEGSQKPKSPQEKTCSPGTSQERRAGKPSPELCRGLETCW